MKRHIITGIRCGLRAWLAYGVVEFMLAFAIPVLFQHQMELLPWQWRPIALLFGVYGLLGVVLGGAGGAVLAWTGGHEDCGRRTPAQIVAVLTLVAAFVANLIPAWPLRASEYVALTIAAMLAASFVGAIASSVWLERVAFLANPWVVSSLLLAFPWVSSEALRGHTATVRTGGALLLCGVIVALAALWHGSRSGRMERIRRQAIVAGAAMVLLLGGVWVAGTHRAVRANQASEPSASAKCNVLLITMDTVRADHLSVYGYERDTTPHLRDFAREATVYTRAIAAADMTLPTHASIFTGLYPGWHGADIAPPGYPFGRPLAPRYTTLAEVLHSKGYWTAAVVANYAYLQPSLGLAAGFTVFDFPFPVRMSTSKEPFFLREGGWRVLSLVTDTAAVDAHSLRAADIDRRASTLLAEARHGRSFFLFLNYMDAHDPYISGPPFNRRFPGRDPNFKTSGYEGLRRAVNTGKRQIGTTEKCHLQSQYDGGIAYMDSEIGNLLGRLREMGLYENTLIIITSDHGEAFGEHDVMQHGMGSVYQDQVYVPLLIKYPGQHEPRESDTLASQVDLMPTILDVAGISLPSGVQGRTLRLPPPEGAYAVYSQAVANTYLCLANRRFRGVRRAIFSGSLKLITWTEGPPELYDLAADPGETHNLYRAGDPEAKALADRLSAWAATAPQKFEEPGKLDKSSFEKLKSLGYAQ